MTDWQKRLARLASRVERHVDEARRQIDARLEKEPPPLRIEAYHGYGTARSVVVRGRVLEDKGIEPARPEDPWWTNLRAMVRRLESDEVPWARVRIRLGGAEVETTANEEGHFAATLQPRRRLASGWVQADLDLLEPIRPAAPPVRTVAEVLVPDPAARLGVISDIDDTVVRTDATDPVRMARQILLGNVHGRLPFPGVAAFFQALHAGTGIANPLFYVSSSPWNLHDVLLEFFRLRGIPAGPLFLRDWGLSATELLPTGHKAHKLERIRSILRTYPELPFLLVGDSGQEDPEIYHDIVHEHPGRIPAVYIRSVVADPLRIDRVRALAEEVAAAGSTLVLADDTLAAARHAAGRGWISQAAVQAVAAEQEQDLS